MMIEFPLIGMLCRNSDVGIALASSNQIQNFNDDLEDASNHWIHINRAWDYKKSGQYDRAVDEYKIAIEIIQKSPGDEWPNLQRGDADRINQTAKIDEQIFPRYGLVEALEGAGRYDEAIQNVEWLMQNQQMKGKEEFLKQKLEGMKRNLVHKLQQTQHTSSPQT